MEELEKSVEEFTEQALKVARTVYQTLSANTDDSEEMTGEQMFNELGYTKMIDDTKASEDRVIFCDLSCDCIEISATHVGFYSGVKSISSGMLAAINKVREERGWI